MHTRHINLIIYEYNQIKLNFVYSLDVEDESTKTYLKFLTISVLLLK